jgi:hypothetical protein
VGQPESPLSGFFRCPILFMPTQSQIEANRRNSQHSTGPRTLQGKAASSRNALKSGIDAQSSIITGEDAAALAALSEQFYRDCQPQTATESALVDNLIHATWLLRRFRRIDAEIIDHQIRHNTYPSHDAPAGLAFIATSNHQTRLQRRINDTLRGQREAIKELERLQAERPQPQPQPPAPQPAPQLAPQLTDTESARPSIDFVPQTPVLHPPPDSPPWPPVPKM